MRGHWQLAPIRRDSFHRSFAAIPYVPISNGRVDTYGCRRSYTSQVSPSHAASVARMISMGFASDHARSSTCSSVSGG